MTRIAINGLGRIGRRLLRLLVERRWLDGRVELAAINDHLSAGVLAYLLGHDSLHGKAAFDVRSARSSCALAEDDVLMVDGREIPCTCVKHRTGELLWKQLGADIVIESTGMHAWCKESLQGHLRAGARQVIVTAMSPPADITIVPGVNHDRLDPGHHHIISTGAALTQAVTPVMASLCSGGHDIEEGSITLMQCLYPTLPVLDRPSKHCWREGRGMNNVIPGSHGGGWEAGLVLPELRGKLMSSVFFVPVPGVCAVSMVVRLCRSASLDDVIANLRQSSRRELRGLLRCCDDPIVSSDVLGDTHSAVLAAQDATATSDLLHCLPLFYDPETGYADRVLDVLERLCP